MMRVFVCPKCGDVRESCFARGPTCRKCAVEMIEEVDKFEEKK